MIKFLHEQRKHILLICAIVLIFQNVARLPSIWVIFILGIIMGMIIGSASCLVYYRE